MEKLDFKTKQEFDEFISKIKLEDIVLSESSSKVLLIAKPKEQLQPKINLSTINTEIVPHPKNKKDFLIVCTIMSNLDICKDEDVFFTSFAKIQAIYRVSDLELSEESIKRAVECFAKESAYVHSVAFLRTYFIDIVTKSGFPRFILPLFKQLKDSEYIEK